MNWTELLRSELTSTYAVTERLFAMVDDSALAWKPSTGENWMTTGQLLKHITEGCGGAFRAFITGDSGIPEGTDLSAVPTASALPAVGSVAEAQQLLAADRLLAFEMLAQPDEETLANAPAPAPWDSCPRVLGHRLLQMIEHQKQHKGQLFYYLKLQRKPVTTPDLWGS